MNRNPFPAIVFLALSACNSTSSPPGNGLVVECIDGTCDPGQICDNGICRDDEVISVCITASRCTSDPGCMVFPKVRVFSNDVGRRFACWGPGDGSECVAQELTYEGYQISFHLRFSNSIVGNYSTEAFRTKFISASIGEALSIPGLREPYCPSADRNYDALDDIRYEDGRLIFSVTSHGSSVRYDGTSLDLGPPPDGLLLPNTTGICACVYSAEFDHTLIFSLPILP